LKQIFNIFAFTFRDAIRKKPFIISTIIILSLIFILCVSVFIANIVYDGNLINNSDVGNIKNRTCYYIDDENLINDGMAALESEYTDTLFVKKTAADIEDLRVLVSDDSKSTIVYITKADENPNISIIYKDFMATSQTLTQAVEILNRKYITNVMIEKGVDSEIIDFSQSVTASNVEIAGSMDLTGYALGLVLTMLIFFAVYYYGYGVASSIANEKASRVMETLLVSAKPSRILFGKCLGMGVVGLSQFLLILLFSAFCYNVFIPDNFLLFGMPLSLENFTFSSALLIVLYFLLGYALYAMMNAVCGALVSKIEDLNSAMMPVMLISMASFYVGYFVSISGDDGIISKIAMYVPFSAPFIVPFKILNSDATAPDVLISIVLLLATITLVSFVSVKIYSASVMHYGKRLKIKEAYKTKVN